jgi:prepilin-type N-terminal cleavage/methylation domain-containing protein
MGKPSPLKTPASLRETQVPGGQSLGVCHGDGLSGTAVPGMGAGLPTSRRPGYATLFESKKGGLEVRYRTGGFTLVELLVVIAIIGVLVALLLPAVQAARESARRAQCTNHLKNLTLGMVNHESTYKRLPGSGWSGHWTGDPDRGSGKEQPGGWFYAVLPFIEQTQLHDMGKGLTGAARFAALTQRDGTPLDIANCPSRRTGGPYPRAQVGTSRSSLSGNGTGTASNYEVKLFARSDYAASVGDPPDDGVYNSDFDGHCLSISPNQYNTLREGFPPSLSAFTGITFCGTAVKLRQITDGTTNTIALGERYLFVEHYDGVTVNNEDYPADDWSMYAGFQDDLVRSTYLKAVANPSQAPATPTHLPRSDNEEVVDQAIARRIFGGPHPGGVLVSMCDGSVTLVDFDIDGETWRRMGDRRDGGEFKEPPARRK